MTQFHQDELNPVSFFEIEEGGVFPVPPLTDQIFVNLAYCKPDGDTSDLPVLCLVMQDTDRKRYFTQISLRCLKPAIRKLLEQEERQLAKRQ